MHRDRKSQVTVAVIVALGLCGLLNTGCDLLSTVTDAVSTINPCGTILACDPQEYQFITSGIDGPGINVEADPYCTNPPFCDASQDPIFGGLAP